ncbi:hypothetical protein [Pseudoclavibacter sp. AY1H1]|uniref:hypothetical protein n=1 Tax=Pseudoclavibacter sp. AY1H1 TaxID=2080584 RepID=UPI0011AFF224|nr:hypothetical protein [Pseudoclavibacter sp. AY1H1]
MTGMAPISAPSERLTVLYEGPALAQLKRAALRDGVPVEGFVHGALKSAVQGKPRPEVVVISTQQSNDIVRLIRANFDNTTIADWVHVDVSTVEAIRKELS